MTPCLVRARACPVTLTRAVLIMMPVSCSILIDFKLQHGKGVTVLVGAMEDAI